MPHGADLLRCFERVRSAQNTEESTSCTLSIKIEPDTRGLDPGIHVLALCSWPRRGWPGQARPWRHGVCFANVPSPDRGEEEKVICARLHRPTYRLCYPTR